MIPHVLRSLQIQAISVAEDLRDNELISDGYINKGYMYEAFGKDVEARKFFEQALEFSENEDYIKGSAIALYRIGRSYSFQGIMSVPMNTLPGL